MSVASTHKVRGHELWQAVCESYQRYDHAYAQQVHFVEVCVGKKYGVGCLIVEESQRMSD